MKTNFKYFGIFLLLFVVTSFFAFSNMVLAQGDQSAQITEALSQNSKIIYPERVLQDFIDGKSTTRVIINLSKPAGFQQVTAFDDKGFRQQLQKAVRESQERVINVMDSWDVEITNRFTYIFGFSAEVTLQGLQDLADTPDVVSIEEDRILHAQLAQGIPLMNASTPRSSYNGSGLAVAICDTGIDYTHPRLGGGGFPNSKVIGGYDCGDNDNDPIDQYGHGTACAGIAAGDLGTVGDYIGGVAYNAKLYAVKISFGSGGSAYESDMIEGWEWCITHQNDDVNNPIMIISTSFGGGMYSSSCDSESTAMTAAAANAVAAGMTLFVSSGNDGYCDSIGWPACISHVISVGAVYDASFGAYYPCISAASCARKYYTATDCSPYSYYYAIDKTLPDMVTSYSNTASFLDLLVPSNQAYTTDISGPGGYTTGDYDSSFGGTSAACPYAAGAAACLQSANDALNGSFLTPAEVKSTLVTTGDLITDRKVSITKPRVNLTAAVDSLGICTYAINPTDASVAASGGTGSVDVTTQAGCSWTAVRNASWIHVTSGDSGTGSGKVNYSVDENTDSARTGTLTIAGQTFTVNQAGGGVCTYAIDPTSANFSLSGGTGSVDVTTQAGCSWTAVSNHPWILIISGHSGTGNGTVNYRVYGVRSARTSTMTIAGETFTVYQGSGGVCTYAINPTSANVNAGGGTGSVDVTTQAGCSWTAVRNASWIHVTSGDSGTGSGKVNYSVDENTDSARTGTMTIAGQTFTVDQGSGGCTYAINPTSANVNAGGGTGSVDVTTQAGCSWTAVRNASWIHVTSGDSGTGSGKVNYSVDENTDSARTGTMTIAGQTFTVNQAGGGVCTYAIDPTSANFSLSGGTGSVDVTTQAGCSWTAVRNDPWIHVTSGDSGTGSGKVNYSVDENTDSARTGTMTIAGQTFTVNQAGGGVCTYAIDPTSVHISRSGGRGSVSVTTQEECSWTAVSNDRWIYIASGNSGTGNGTVSFNVSFLHRSLTSRTGIITIAGETFTVYQP